MRMQFGFPAVLLTALAVQQVSFGQVSITSNTFTYSQNFDTLITSGTDQTWTNNSTLTGWSLFRQPAPGTAITTYNAGAGTSTAGSFYSFGTGTNTERALGGLGSVSAYFGAPPSGSVAGWIAVAFRNDTGTTVTSIDVSYDGEQWRNGGNASLASQTMVMQYGVGNTFETVGTWTNAGAAFDFVSLQNSALSQALDGNAPANRTAGRGGSISTLNLLNNEILWFRWVENNDVGNDHALAIDNFGFQITPVPEPGTVLAFGAVALGAGAFVRRKCGKKVVAADVPVET